jgi:hypothetical protein
VLERAIGLFRQYQAMAFQLPFRVEQFALSKVQSSRSVAWRGFVAGAGIRISIG